MPTAWPVDWCPEHGASRCVHCIVFTDKDGKCRWLDEAIASGDVVRGAGLLPIPPDLINHPPHYKAHPSGVECIQITEHMSFNLGNAVKYIWRADEKGDALEDLRKAAWYVNREIERRTK